MSSDRNQSAADAIPVEWSWRPLSELTDPDRPIGYGIVQTGRPVLNGVKCVRVVDLVEGCIDEESLITTSEDISEAYKRTKLREDDVLIALRGKVGAAGVVPRTLEGSNLTRGVALLSRSPRFNSRFLAQFLASPLGRSEIERNLNGSALQEIPIGSLRKLPVPTPPKSEQIAVGMTLSDVDQLISHLGALILKKRDIKWAATQNLLTGRHRLGGFSDTWPSRRLGELLDYEQPTKYLVRSAEYSDSNEVPVLTAGKTFVLGYTNESDGIVSDLPVIIFDDFTTASKYVDFPFKAKSSAMKLLRLRDRSNDLKIVHQLMRLIDFKLGDHKRYWISEYQNLLINLPGPEEQRAILDILNTMDMEIGALEIRRDEVVALKQGMMQQLLTGRIRLI